MKNCQSLFELRVTYNSIIRQDQTVYALSNSMTAAIEAAEKECTKNDPDAKVIQAKRLAENIIRA